MSKLLKEFVIFSDLHGHNFTYGAKQVPDTEGTFSGLFNSRLMDAADVISEIETYCIQNNIENVLFGGDLFHVRKSVSTDVKCIISSRLEQLSNQATVCILRGNHDMFDRHGYINSLYELKDRPDVFVFDEVDFDFTSTTPVINKFYLGHNIFVHFIPYTDDINKAKAMLSRAGVETGDFEEGTRTYNILLAHLGMQGAKVGSDFVLNSDSDIKVEDIPRDRFEACFFGHFHEHQPVFPNGWFIGAALQHNWGDVGGKRGFLHVKLYKSGEVEIKRIETGAPKFVVAENEEDLKNIKENDFVRVVNNGISESKIQCLDTPHIERIEPSKDEEQEFVLDVDNLNPYSAMEQWVDEKLPEDIDKAEALNWGRSLLSEII